MPHQCTNCGRTFPDGSKEMLSGCPDCGGNKFQFAPAASATAASNSSADADESTTAETASNRATPTGDDSGTDGVTTRAAETVRGWVSSDSTAESDESTQMDGADASWPSSDDSRETPSADDETGFSAWPDSARRPEDRSSSSDQADPTAGQPDPTAGQTDSRAGRPDPAADQPDSTADQTDSRARQADRAGGRTDSPSESDDSSSVPPLENTENSAQADARSEVIPSDELPEQPVQSDDGDLDGGPAVDDLNAGTDAGNSGVDGEGPPDHGRVVSEPSGDRPSIEELRAELNEQFESIKIVRPGQYELNLMELYNRDEYIISLQEDGRYVIDVPDSWREGGDD